MQLNINNLYKHQSIKTIDAHTEGEPLRIITEGYPAILGNTLLEKRQYLIENLDHLRQLLMFEPRGHSDMYGAIITEPCSESAKFGILFMHNEGYSSMCGHGIIAAVTVALKLKAINFPQDSEFIGIDSPAGLIKAYAKQQGSNIDVSFDNVASFVEALNQKVIVDGLGQVTYDLAFGGAYYAFVNADDLNIDCTPNNQQKLIELGRAIKKSIMASYSINHPLEEALGFLYGVIFYTNKTHERTAHSRHVCIFADGELDRSPTGTGVSARAAILAIKEGLVENQPVIIESIVGGKMTVSIEQHTSFHGKEAVIPRVSGRSFITGIHQFMIEDSDIFQTGFLLR